jgi:uncharacterized protein involved in outer membrane biogenesis
MKSKKFLLAILALFVVLAVAPWLIPTTAYITQIEQLATQKLGVPVRIESLHFALLPTPRANLTGLVVGSGEEVRVAEVAAVLDVTTLFDATRVISRLELSEPLVKQSALGLLAGLNNQGASSGPAPVELRGIVLDDAIFDLTSGSLPAMDADIRLGAGSALEKAALTSSDGKLKVNVLPREGGYAATVQAEKWTLPVGPKLTFEALSADLTYVGSTLKFPRIEAALYRGRLTASGQLDWTKNWRLTGQFNTQAIELGEATALFTRAVRVTGRISGSGMFASSAKDADKLGDALALDYKFKVEDGVLHGVDLMKAASLLIRQGATGGETRFDELYGTLHTRGKQIEVRPVHIGSGLLVADGHVKIAADKKLGGQVDTEIKKGVSLVKVPLAISGTMDSPMVLPTKAALAGAAAGTVLMGPLGTNLGTRAGSALQSLFGGGE